MSDIEFLALVDGLEEDRYVIATYLLQTTRDVDIFRRAVAMVVEQRTGTWLPVPEETEEVRRKYGGKVVAVHEVPGEVSAWTCNRSTIG